jgi:hypothetical protein
MLHTVLHIFALTSIINILYVIVKRVVRIDHNENDSDHNTLLKRLSPPPTPQIIGLNRGGGGGGERVTREGPIRTAPKWEGLTTWSPLSDTRQLFNTQPFTDRRATNDFDHRERGVEVGGVPRWRNQCF